jgi:DeoR/GlpR family transcriptional regulator of sugar metabolism
VLIDTDRSWRFGWYGGPVLAARRHDRILEVLRSEGVAEVAHLAQVLGVSETTVRRDLGHLASQGAISRVRGGARGRATPEPPYAQVAARPHGDRHAIADAALDLVGDGDVLLLDIGTTVGELANRLRGRELTVVTSSLAVLEALADDVGIELVLLGGSVRRNYRSTVGYLTEQALEHIHTQRLFLGTSGVHPDGSSWDTSVVEVPIKQAMMRAADEVVLLAGPDKFPGTGLARVCGPDRIDALVCREGTDPTTLEAFAEAGCRVVTA